MTRRPVVVIGVGNPMRTDDGVGPLVAEELSDRGNLGCDIVQLDGEPTRVIDAWHRRRLAIICDAVCWGSEPGTVHEATLADLDGVVSPGAKASSHAAGVGEAVALGQALDRMPVELVVVGIEPADVDFGQGLTAQVLASVTTVVDRIADLIAKATAGGVDSET